MLAQLDSTSHQIVNSDSDSWEALYLQTRGHYYIEFLKNRRANGMGLCQKPFGLMSQNAAHIINDFPLLPWKSYDRTIGGKPWFTAFSCDNYLDLKTPFNTWAMQYHQRDTGKTANLRTCSIERIEKIEVVANPAMIDKIKANSMWFNCKSQFTDLGSILEPQTYYSYPLKIEILFNELVTGFKITKAELVIRSGFELMNHVGRYFSFVMTSQKIILSRN